ncbi:MAG: ABC transporter ATP-binding protein [Alphaproteobacteria bacterium]|nr:ABC transporter ATP-binding protein [Alphaproteobacteria bacterium]
MQPAPTLEVRDYTLDYRTRAGPVRALDAIDLTIGAGEVVGLVGESGSGKTSLAWAIMRALAPNAVEIAGSIKLTGTELTALPASAMARWRGRRIGMVFQDPSGALNPTLTLGTQIAEALIHHHGLGRAAARQESARMFARVGLADPAGMLDRYPHEASGGEKQRVVIATAFACKPELMLFDEPTTALDVITARQILDLFLELQRETAVASLYISHDLAIVSQIARRVAVLQRGRIVEAGEIADVFSRPRHPYTTQLLAAVPRPESRLAGEAPPAPTPLVTMRDLTVRYGRAPFLASLLGAPHRVVTGAKAVSLDINPGEILGVVGESGSGKSTLARVLIGLAPFAGALTFDGRAIGGRQDMDSSYRRDVQVVFQHPDSSLNPRQRIGEILARPFRLYGDHAGRPIAQAVADLLLAVKLQPDFAQRFPHQLSGGEKQRVAIARAFASRPRLVLCDEVTSSLDVSVQATVIELLIELQRRSGASYLFISHDINLVRLIAHRIAVLYRGELVETVTPSTLAVQGPRHLYTAALMAAVPTIKSAAA